jgi:phosphate starvation-inducible PhoH-like protein
MHARRILERVEGIAFCGFTEVDVVRHPLVQEVIRAYDRADAEANAAEAARAEQPATPATAPTTDGEGT